ncbi:MAG: hypothetical protein AB7P03_16505 [Kofleriaceae bacterium]
MRKAPLAPTPALEPISDDDLADVNGGCKCKGSSEISVQIGNPAAQADVGAAPPTGGYGGYAPPPPQPAVVQYTGGGGGMSPAALMMLLSMMSGSK